MRGLVQGVFFRRFVQGHAEALGLRGWVRNLSDGASVEVVAEGPKAFLEELAGHLKRGPAGARVESVDIEWSPPSGQSRGFQIRG